MVLRSSAALPFNHKKTLHHGLASSRNQNENKNKKIPSEGDIWERKREERGKRGAFFLLPGFLCGSSSHASIHITVAGDFLRGAPVRCLFQWAISSQAYVAEILGQQPSCCFWGTCFPSYLVNICRRSNFQPSVPSPDPSLCKLLPRGYLNPYALSQWGFFSMPLSMLTNPKQSRSIHYAAVVTPTLWLAVSFRSPVIFPCIHKAPSTLQAFTHVFFYNVRFDFLCF